MRSTKRGFTLIELMVVMALAAIVVGGIGVSIVNIRKADLKAASGMMGGAMRYMYNLAVINNTPYRLVIDMDESTFWGEELQTDDPCARFLPLEDEEGEADAKEDVGEEDDGPVGLDPRARTRRVAQGNFTRTKDNLLSMRKLPQGIVVTGVMTSLNQGPRQDGKIAIHFFPGGHAEPAYIWIGERDDEEEDTEPSITLELDSLMGRVTRHNEALEESSFAKGLDS